ncbi:MAG: L-histidine N(alpha)-methyltransferase [Vicinamibacterales bacterium]
MSTHPTATPPTPDAAAPRQTGAPTEDARLSAIWKRAYGARTRDDLKALYKEWAESYDKDHAQVGFFGHRLTAEVLARHTTRHDVARVLDAGAGTGAAGEALHALGFRRLVAVDLSEDMIDVARRKGVYRETLVADLSVPLDAFAAGSFDAAILVGVFSYGQAPPETLDEILRLVRPGGVVAFTMRTDFFDEDAMGVRSRMESFEERGLWKQLEVTEPAPYLPGKDPNAMFRVWCYRVTARLEAEIEEGFEDAVREALESDDYVKKIDHAWIWDSTASRLYERYTRTAGYYLTDSEEAILRARAGEIIGDETLIVELGCGSARKIRHVLAAAVERGKPVRYMPIDVSPGAVRATVAEVEQAFGDKVAVEPRQGLFEDILPTLPVDDPKLVFFFGSSLGNLDTIADTVAFLGRLRERLNPADRFVVGVDLHKDEAVLERAYNEEEWCRSFFAHMLRRINFHLGADFDPRVFELSSTYEQEPEYQGLRTRRMSLRVAPTIPQHTWVRKLGIEVQLEPGQPVQVGISRKYEPEQLAALAELAHLRLARQWFDDRHWFSLNELVRDDRR